VAVLAHLTQPLLALVEVVFLAVEEVAAVNLPLKTTLAALVLSVVAGVETLALAVVETAETALLLVP
jgi:hypothetical protein